MRVKHRLVCPKCGEGFIVNPKPHEECITFIGDPIPLIRYGSAIPHCTKCGEHYKIQIDTETLEIEINDIYK